MNDGWKKIRCEKCSSFAAEIRCYAAVKARFLVELKFKCKRCKKEQIAKVTPAFPKNF